MATPHNELTATQAMKDALTGESTHRDPHHAPGHAHQVGTMDVTVQERTFAGFMTWVTRGAIIVATLIVVVLLIFG